MAKALEGRRVGDEVEVPAEDGSRICTIVEVTGLSDDVRAWIGT